MEQRHRAPLRPVPSMHSSMIEGSNAIELHCLSYPLRKGDSNSPSPSYSPSYSYSSSARVPQAIGRNADLLRVLPALFHQATPTGTGPNRYSLSSPGRLMCTRWDSFSPGVHTLGVLRPWCACVGIRAPMVCLFALRTGVLVHCCRLIVSR